MSLRAEHVVVAPHDGNYRLMCKRCLETDEVETPVDVREFVWKTRDFLDAHEGCEWPRLGEHTGIPPGHSGSL